jgi:hypothetical protein
MPPATRYDYIQHGSQLAISFTPTIKYPSDSEQEICSVTIYRRTTQCYCLMISTLLRIREVPCSKLGLETGYPDSFVIIFLPHTHHSII